MATRCNLSDAQIDARLSTLERIMLETTETSTLASLNSVYQRLIDEQVRRELDREDQRCG